MHYQLLLALVALCTTAYAVQDDFDTYGCGIHTTNLNLRLVGGTAAQYGEFPWVAVLNYIQKVNSRFVGVRCAGSVINNRYIMTAANCLHINGLSLTNVWLGVRKRSEVDTIDYHKVQRYRIEETYPHPDYDPITDINDIALIKLDRRIVYTDYVRPICLPQSYEEIPVNGTLLSVAAWGQPNKSPMGQYSDVKLKIETPLYSYQECYERLHYNIRLDQVCAEGEYLKGTCWGDGGAPMMLPRCLGHYGTTWFAVGVISSTLSCGAHAVPLVHTRVSYYVPWMMSVIHSRPLESNKI